METSILGLQHGEGTRDPTRLLTWFINKDTLHALARGFAHTYRALAKSSSEHFLLTPVTALPSGSEHGKFLAIDVGGSNLRVGFVELVADDTLLTNGHATVALENGDMPKIRRSYEKAWPIEEHFKMDQPDDLFRWIGDCIAEVITDAISSDPSNVASFGEELPLGITFSFPMMQRSMAEATLLPMGKGFAITSNLNLGEMLLAGYARHCQGQGSNGGMASTASVGVSKQGLPRLRIAAITNDGVATFASLAYAATANPASRVAMGLIVGTGCNATVPMKVKDLSPEKVQNLSNVESITPESHIVINTEWTIRGTDAPMRELNIPTVWDAELDRDCQAPGFQPFEYMTAGRYLGEVVRLAFVDILKSRQQHRRLPPNLQQRNSISTYFLSTTASQPDDKLLIQKLTELFPFQCTSSDTDNDHDAFWTSEDAQLLREIAKAAQLRSSALIAAAIVGLLTCVKDIDLDESPTENIQTDSTITEELIVAYTGRTISDYPGFLSCCQDWVDRLVRHGSPLNSSKRVLLHGVSHGGVVGAAVLAGVADNMA